MVTAVKGPLVAPASACTVTDCPASTVALCVAATGTASGVTVMLTVAAVEVPPGPVAV